MVLAVAFAASVTALRNGFVYDDVQVVVENPRLHTLDSLPQVLGGPYWSPTVLDRLYRPLTSASFVADWVLGGGRPFAFHATNLALHLVVVALVLALGGLVLGRGALVAALWFAVHPVHVEAVANVVGRSELLAAAAYLAATLAYLADGAEARARPGSARRAGLAMLVLALAAVAFGAKEHALSLPAALLAADAWVAWRERRPVLATACGHAVLWGGVVALALGYLALRGLVIGTVFGGGAVGAGLYGLPLGERAVVMLPVVLVGVRLLVAPLLLSADYAPGVLAPDTTFGAPHTVALLAVVAVLVAAWRLRHRAPGVLAGIGWFAITVAVASNVVFPTGILFAERLLYLPSVGAALAVGALWELLPRHRAVWPATALALGLLGARTLSRIPVWRTPEAFFAARAADAPASYRTHWQRGGEAFARGDARRGERELLDAVRIWPYDPELLEEIGGRYLEAGILAPADRFSTAAFRLDSTRTSAAARAVLARWRAGRPDSALALAATALRRDPVPADVALAAVAVAGASGRDRLALTVARRLVFRDPRRAAYQLVAGDVALRLGLCEEGRMRFARALATAGDEPARVEARRRLDAPSACRGAR